MTDPNCPTCNGARKLYSLGWPGMSKDDDEGWSYPCPTCSPADTTADKRAKRSSEPICLCPLANPRKD